MKKALFLDRDGVINHDKDDGSFTYKVKDFVILEDVVEVLKLAKQKDFLLIVITNQSGIGRGIYSHQHVEEVHSKLEKILAANQIVLDEIYYCPHHPSSSNCICRKPDSVLVEKAIARFNINPKQSIFVGDKERDITCALKAGIENVYQIETNSSLKQIIHAIENV
jgi:D-glycero-D-manno-heptose 1,7-bisphosphate phosphatase